VRSGKTPEGDLPAVVLLDFKLSKVNGLAVLQRVAPVPRKL
jgi:hypothetical protein